MVTVMSLSTKLAKTLEVPTKDRRKDLTGSLNEDASYLQVTDRSYSQRRSRMMHPSGPYNYVHGNAFNV